ncbi:MAG: ABC transporter permease [Anaerolineales bacterium]|nr:ABC transporter permease [Anaerolineales bacterium]
MKNTLIIIKHEIITTLQKRSFWFLTFVFPAVILLLSVGLQAFGQQAIMEAEEAASDVQVQASLQSVGYVDEAGVIQELPVWLPEDFYTAYPDEAAAQAALQAGQINQYYLVPANFLEQGEYYLVDSNYNPLIGSTNAEIFDDILADNMAEAAPYGELLYNPTPSILGYSQAPEASLDEDSPATYFVPLAVMFIFFFVLTTSSGFMLSSVTKEKENRTAEILLVSIAPRSLMLGKVIGLGVVALLQMGIWLGGSLFGLDRASEVVEALQAISLPEGFVLWALAFFILGYFTYAAILGAVGTLVPNAREGGQFTFLALLPLMIPIWFNVTFTESPDGPFSVFLSMFPLTAPTSMLTRMVATEVPLWQTLLSLLGLALAAYLFVLLAARLFRADTLLSSDSLSFKRLVRVVRKQGA